MGTVETDLENTVAADPAPDDEPIAGVGNWAGQPQPAAEVAAPATKQTKLNLQPDTYACSDHLSSEPPRVKRTICDTHLGSIEGPP